MKTVKKERSFKEKALTVVIIGICIVLLYGLFGTVKQTALNAYYNYLVESGQYEETYIHNRMRDPETNEVTERGGK